MCIVLSTTSNPDYSLIVISNRDEVFERSSERLDFRVAKEGEPLLMGLDNLNKGTWLCIDSDTKSFAVVLNVQSLGKLDLKPFSRGFLPLEVLKCSKKLPESFEEFQSLYSKAIETRYFKLLYGVFENSKTQLKYRLLSLADDEIPVYKDLADHAPFVTSNQYESCSENVESEYKWNKISIGEHLMAKLAILENEETLIKNCFEISEHDTFTNDNQTAIEFKESKLKVRSSVFIPKHKIKILNKELTYGTRTTTLILVRRDGSVRIIERERTDPNSIDRSFELF
ncbi:hypothetical protein QEN19_004097 [Hanseniaspora menglaensis]